MAGGGGNEPNLTPFIDLFSVMICFLLMTAAWVQLESMQVQIDQKPKAADQDVASAPPPEDDQEKKAQLSLKLERTKVVAKENEDVREFPLPNEKEMNPDLKVLIGVWVERYPRRNPIVIQSGEQATYGQLIHLYDLVTQAGITDVAISPY